MPATFACCRRAPLRRSRQLPSATVSSRGSRAGSAFGRSASSTSRPHRVAWQNDLWTLRSLIGLSIEGLTSFSVAPLRLASLLGLLLAAGALVFGA